MNNEGEQERKLDMLKRVREWMQAITLVASSIQAGETDDERDAFCIALFLVCERGRYLAEGRDERH